MCMLGGVGMYKNIEDCSVFLSFRSTSPFYVLTFETSFSLSSHVHC